MSRPVLSAYRNLLKAQRIAFVNDTEMILAAQAKTREGFLANATESDNTVIEEQLEFANQTADYLRTKVVQAVQDESDETYYRMNLKKHHSVEAPPGNVS
eukprot:TRINITY_DN7721_c0_g2_i1.p1 TRINITY_DN7721_c0_g2~~TRINITY_DN7721_c0_g2_i1.p1  ORF type:complete len:111 (+),score=25.75 TRINITY_DN7721_c0_g2_i1:35-334(+)